MANTSHYIKDTCNCPSTLDIFALDFLLQQCLLLQSGRLFSERADERNGLVDSCWHHDCCYRAGDSPSPCTTHDFRGLCAYSSCFRWSTEESHFSPFIEQHIKGATICQVQLTSNKTYMFVFKTLPHGLFLHLVSWVPRFWRFSLPSVKRIEFPCERKDESEDTTHFCEKSQRNRNNCLIDEHQLFVR